ncbi:Protein of uncharacterised function (DUF1415) [Legionella lansingensis]|uniref:DUF1415 domain-containing protein n=1 Tax=Legionella lansingensis TaxID=45067 RepID=A0A0W0VEI0_9GAMM|nr:DUF1415 domain-containing protein [Legionella lansingensis]KTD18549.1 hypothetical protein Llan_2507 [Legionella lansingensis]SNV51255.1 Protein of uncharacterised function (DUF1415) [Legionella lansingensis]
MKNVAIDESKIIAHTQKWLQSFVIQFNLCPFAKREVERKSVRMQVSPAQNIQQATEDFFSEIMRLESQQGIETTLLILPYLFKDFFHYLDFIELCELFLLERGYEGIYQIASFHPNYCFAEEAFDDVSHYTNRSPYPMIHLLREKSLEKAIKFYGATEAIPERNINTMRKLGLVEIGKILANCFQEE